MKKPALNPLTKIYQVQYVLPVDNPMNKVRVEVKNRVSTFLVPINHPFAHSMGLQELLGAAKLSEEFTVLTGLNNKRLTQIRESINTDPCEQSNSTELPQPPPAQSPR